MDPLIEKFSTAPDGSPGKKLYDSYALTTEEYIRKYYSSNTRAPEFIQFYKKVIEPLYSSRSVDEYKLALRGINLRSTPLPLKAQEFYDKIIDHHYSEELKKILGAIYSIGFFGKSTYEEWMNSEYWHDFTHKNAPPLPSVNTILKMPYGENFLIERLAMISPFQVDK